MHALLDQTKMPKWIGNSKRRHPKDEHKKEDSEEKALHKGGVHQDRGSSGAASLTSDSGRSMSPSDSDSELRLVEDIGSRIDWTAVQSMADQQQQQQRRGEMMMTVSCHETPNDSPLDLSVSGPLGRKNTTTAAVSSLLGGRRYYPIAIDDDEVKVHAAVTSGTDVHLLEEMNRRRRLPLLLNQQNHLKNYGARWEVAPRHLRLFANSFSEEKVTRKRHHVTVEDNDDDDDDGEGRGRIPEVHATPEAVAQLQSIENKIGEYNCMLCGNHYENAFHLANHNCSCIVKVVHRCPECNKVFQCPANLASHRRWHGIRGAHLEQSFPNAPEAAADAAAAAAKASSRSASSTCT